MILKDIKGIGEKTERLFNKINIFSDEDLLSYFPYRYNFYTIRNINNCEKDVVCTVTGVIESTPKVSFIKRNFNILSFRCIINNLLVNIKIFNRAFYKNNIKVGNDITLIGKYDEKNNTFIANNMFLKKIENNKIEPMYHLIKGLNNNQISKSVGEIICNKVTDYIPKEYIDKYNFISKQDAIKYIHFPNSIDEIKKAKVRLIYEELFNFSIKMNTLKYKRLNDIDGIKKDFDDKLVSKLIDSISFDLTKDQEKAIKDILLDMKSNKRMNRIIIGDVGSGKTIVAFIAMYANHMSGFQSAFLAPTEILARQHYDNLKKLLPSISIELLTGKTSIKEKKLIKEKIKNNEVSMVIGTHALLTDDVLFNNLGLIITDEQHRFGVNQRIKLINKGNHPDVIYMSATPIPRTYALALYGDMDVSLIKTKPIGRKDVITIVKNNKEIKEVLSSIKEELTKGHQVFVVAPQIENEEDDIKSVLELKEKFDIAFNNKVSVEIIHGNLKQESKNIIMDSFINKEIQILISTTVIEVGVDVKNATIMVIFNAELFGLATLHQLRGRVGRNDLDSYCYLISDSDTERLNILKSSNDGFYISEQDFILRREGDLFGTKQSGDMSFKIADIKRDFKILEQTTKDSWEYINK